jgi:molybdopterin/thiamine biosynthesis adenylyltransferase
MKKAKAENAYKSIIFLKDDDDKALLHPQTRLYGRIVHSTRTIFMTPYPPPSQSFPLIGVVQKEHSPEQKQSALLTVFARGQSFVVMGIVNNQNVESRAKIVYKTASYARTPFSPAEMKLLSKKTVTILGAGTGGSKIAAELARAGVDQFKSCDPERMDLANVSRHEGNLFDVGKPKTQIVAEHLYTINPATLVKTYFEDIFERPLEQVEEILNSDLVVAATDITAIQLSINELTYKRGIPCVFGGCYEEARGGEVFYTLPGEKMPCLACLRANLKQPKTSVEIDYSTATGPDDYQGEPGLHAAIDFVTCLEVQICLAILLREVPTSRLAKLIDPRFNFILVGGALASGFYRFKKPFHIFFQPLKGPRKDCLVCGDSSLLLRNVIDEQSEKEDLQTNFEMEDK